MKSVEQKLRAIFSEQLGISENEIHTGDSIIEDLGSDSLDMVELVMAAEDEFEIQLPDGDEGLENCKTFGDAVLLIQEKLESNNEESPAPAA